MNLSLKVLPSSSLFLFLVIGFCNVFYNAPLVYGLDFPQSFWPSNKLESLPSQRSQFLQPMPNQYPPQSYTPPAVQSLPKDLPSTSQSPDIDIDKMFDDIMNKILHESMPKTSRSVPCQENEAMTNCINPCNDCINRGNCQSPVCKPGCDCLPGYLRNKNGDCIKKEGCPPVSCSFNEEPSYCVNPCNNCADRGKCEFLVCNPGCDCLPGYFRNQKGVCIKEDRCPPTSCPLAEEPSDCVNPCNGCAVRGKCQFLVCNPGCDCLPGYFRNDKGICITEDRCPPTSCSINEEPSYCVNPCNNCVDRGKCDLVCNPSCDCLPGYFRNENGICILERNCPIKSCPINEQPSNCVIPCNTCAKRGKCKFSDCNAGCDCLPGYFRNQTNACIKEERCPPSFCPFNEMPTYCVNPCNTCSERGKCEFLDCNPGCDCLPGYFRNENSVCIKEDRCKPTACSINEEPSYCVNPCNNCADRGKCDFLLCDPGCDCLPGYFRNDNGICILERNCPITSCPINEYRSSCVIPCNNCVDRGKCQVPICKPGCDCLPGYFRNQYNVCIKKERCPPVSCSLNEVPSDCVSTCNTCTDRGKCEILVCNPGCDCRPGYFRNEYGICVLETYCPMPSCPINERQSSCVSYCNTCAMRGKCKVSICHPGCDCTPGYFRNSEGVCIEEKLCPPNLCGRNEVPTNCVIPCNNCFQRGNCKFTPCKSGCDCLPGHFRNHHNVCIKEEHCIAHPCPINERRSNCVIPCNSCVNRGKCEIPDCLHGCDCKPEHFRNENGTCIPKESCPLYSCKVNEEPSNCVIPCNNCLQRGKCQFKSCKPGCDCLPGYFRRRDGLCVKEKRCPANLCPKNERPSQCVSSCNDCFRRGKCETPVCRRGCDCRPGYFRNESKVCIAKESCPSVSCPENEKFSDCVNICNNCADRGKCETKSCRTGCDCLPGYFRNENGRCIEEGKCPSACGPDEEYYNCTPNCTNRCDYTPDTICAKSCNPGCFCARDLVMNQQGKCVPPKQCDKKQVRQFVCTPEEEYYDCIPDCTNRCDYKLGTPCEAGCKDGCYCRHGLVKNKRGECIYPEQCNDYGCSPQEEYYECIPQCNRCGYKSGDDCDKPCENGCYCRKGLVKNSHEQCVKPDQCIDHNCGQDEEYYECIPDCKNRCDYSPQTVCTTECRSGCYCREDLVKNSQGQCVYAEKCDNIRNE